MLGRGPWHKSNTGGISRVLAAEDTAEGGCATLSRLFGHHARSRYNPAFAETGAGGGLALGVMKR